MKTVTAALMASALFASPTLACSWGKTASHETPEKVASMMSESETAISTFDPASKPVFEEEAEAKANTGNETLFEGE